MNIRKVAIIGAGAMGSAYAVMLMDTEGFSVSFVARGERYGRHKQRDLIINGKPYQLSIDHPDKVSGPAELIPVALKHHHLPDAVDDINAFVDEDTIVLSVR